MAVLSTAASQLSSVVGQDAGQPFGIATMIMIMIMTIAKAIAWMMREGVDIVDYGKIRPRQSRVTGVNKRHFAIDIRFGVEHAIDTRIVFTVLGIVQKCHSVGQYGPGRFVC
jgi:hypothetical protein